LNVPDLIREKLAALAPESISIEDESAKHVGHAGAAGGGGHYRLSIVSRRFAGQSLQARHRMIYAALGVLMRREIHALTINAYAPDEAPTHSHHKEFR
jgi:BolA protein